jgi:RNase P/RNase MRP subunit p29
VARPASREARLELQEQTGYYFFTKGDYAYAFAEASILDVTVVEVGCGFDVALHLFDLRNVIEAHASRRGLDARFSQGGEIWITGLTGESRVDGIRLQRRLRLRVTEDGYPDLETRIVARHDSRWLVEGSLARAELKDRATGERAERLFGNGPRGGEVVNITDESAVLRTEGNEVTVPASEYTLTVRASYVRRYHHPETLTRLQVLSGSLTPTGRRNRYAVKDRFQALLDSMDQLGWTMDMPGGRQAHIEQEWTEVRIQERET